MCATIHSSSSSSRRSSSSTSMSAVLLVAAVLLAAVPVQSASGRSLLTSPPRFNTVCRCPKIYLPVCGANGVVFPNDCSARCAGVAVTGRLAGGQGGCAPVGGPVTAVPIAAGRPAVDPVPPTTSSTGPNNALNTPPPRPLNANTNGAGPACPCPRIYSPVCASDNNRYNNKCLAECAGATVTGPADGDSCGPAATAAGPRPFVGGPRHLLASQAAQQQRQPGRLCPCPLIFAPVCGANGQRFDNKCLAECAGVSVAGPSTRGNCAGVAGNPSGPTSQPLVPSPTDSRNLSNDRLQPPGRPTGNSRPSWPLLTNGNGSSGSASRPPACACALLLAPVCGVDGRSYSNSCVARCAGISTTSRRPDANGNCQ